MEPGSAKYQFCSCLPHAWNFAPLWSVHRHPGMLLQQFSPPSTCLWHILQMSLMLSLHHWQWWEVRCEISKAGTGPTTQTNSAPGLRTPYLCQHRAAAAAGTSHSQHAQLWISNKTLRYVVKTYAKLTARSKSHNYQTKGQTFLWNAYNSYWRCPTTLSWRVFSLGTLFLPS